MLRVKLFQSSRRLFEGTATQVVLPAEAGELAVLDCHAPMLSALAEGVTRIDEVSFPVRDGIVFVARNLVTIVTH